MKVKKFLFWTLLLTLVATPLLAMETGKPIRRRRNDCDQEHDGEENSVTLTEENRRQEEILGTAPAADDLLRGTKLPSEKDHAMPSSQGSGLQHGERATSISAMDPQIDRLSYSSIPSYRPNPDVTKTPSSARIVQLTESGGSLRRGIEDGEFNSFSPTSTKLADHDIRAF